ncbi:MAG: hydantoinase/oxoprolinase family protein [Pseudomonadales bacterium]
MAKALLGIDTGGTFTDFVLFSGHEQRVHKVLSNPVSPQTAILEGINDMALSGAASRGELVIVHGTTVATNAALEGKGVRTAYITNKGLRDLLLIGRQTRDRLYDLTPSPRAHPFEPELLFEIDCRMDAQGKEVTPLTQEKLRKLKAEVDALAPEAIAINLLFSFLQPAHEIAIEELFSGEGCNYFVSRSSTVLPEYREYERGMTTWLNAWIGPLIHQYLTELGEALAPSSLSIMQSSGLTIASNQAANRAVNLLLSGPAGGLAASIFIGNVLNRHKLMTFDMGGTSTDVSLLDGAIKLTNEGRVAGFPVGVPMADIHTIGAGGGSIAYVDAGGLLQVGPESAGAEPGPACYGRGGTRPTVTDANLVLGRLREDAFLGGRMQLDRSAAEAAMAPLAQELGISIVQLAFGIIQIANEHMSQALRVISIQRGHDPREFTLACFGGAGGLHFCDLAESLQMTEAIVPINSGVLSAFGMLASPPGRELIQTHRCLLSALDAQRLADLYGELESQGKEELAAEGIEKFSIKRSLDLRYQGQTFTINVAYSSLDLSTKEFHQAHKQQYGHDLDRPVEMLNLRVHLEADTRTLSLPVVGEVSQVVKKSISLEGIEVDVPLYQREDLPGGYAFDGPALVTEHHSTTLVKIGWHAQIDTVGNLVLQRTEG